MGGLQPRTGAILCSSLENNAFSPPVRQRFGKTMKPVICLSMRWTTVMDVAPGVETSDRVLLILDHPPSDIGSWSDSVLDRAEVIICAGKHFDLVTHDRIIEKFEYDPRLLSLAFLTRRAQLISAQAASPNLPGSRWGASRLSETSGCGN
jgi:hypothetical protein